jgi:Kef-type K+ transport system membrane component KefB
MHDAQLGSLFFLDVIVILVVCRVVGWLSARFLRQPQVVGEMIAGVLLGPSVLGLLAPHVETALFPAQARSILYVLAQFGVGLYMFCVGLDFRREHFVSNAKSAGAVSLSGMAAPFALAVLLAPWLTRTPGLFMPGVGGLQATLFLGAAMAITAFPMLARIIHERGLSASPIGALALSAGAIDDAGAWTVLAIVLASLGAGPMAAVKAVVGGGLFAAVALTIGGRLLAPLGRIAAREGGVGPGLLAITLALFAMAAGLMDSVGIHAVFGGFILGAAMPRGLFAESVRRQVEPFTTVLLLPVFFTFSGLNTQLTMVNSVGLIGVTAAIVLASVFAKGGACYVAARACGEDKRTAMGVAALMNARGLMELIIVNIGLQRHIIGVTMFSILTLMAIVTTVIASPLFDWGCGRFLGRDREEQQPDLAMAATESA